jgi:hypothetical protein
MVGDRAGLFADLELRRRRAQISARHECEPPEAPGAVRALAS